MADISIAVVGLGPRALSTWIPLLQRISGFRIVALCDPIERTHDRARALIDHDVPAFMDYREVLDRSDVHAVALTVRSPDQGALAAAGLRAGKHVHAEVPAAHSIADCWQIVLAAERSGRIYALAEQTRYWGFVQAWRELVSTGRLGHISLCEGQYFHHLPADKFRDPTSGDYVGADHPGAVPTWQQRMPPIHYLPHELSPMLKVLNDRVVQVVGMSTRATGYAHPDISQPDMQVALMKTAGDTILRMAASFNQPHPEGDWHWYHLSGSGGTVEWKRSRADHPKQWFADGVEHDLVPAGWSYERADAPADARGSGHGDADYYCHIAFRDAVRDGVPLELDVYGAMDIAAPAILAAESIYRGNVPLTVPDFRPGPRRAVGQAPAAA